MLVAFALGIYIFLIYRVSVNNEFYSKDFNRALVLMALVTAGIVLAVQSNLVISLGMVGALSIVRYRTAVKSPLDLFFLFWSISIGIICGAGLYLLAVIMCIAVTLGLFITGMMNSPVSLGLLIVNCDSLDSADETVDMIREHTKFLRMKNKTVSSDNVELVLEYKSKSDHELERALADKAGINRFAFVNYDRETRI